MLTVTIYFWFVLRCIKMHKNASFLLKRIKNLVGKEGLPRDPHLYVGGHPSPYPSSLDAFGISASATPVNKS